MATGPPEVGAAQVKVTVLPTTVATRLVGGPGAAGTDGTVTVTTFDSGPAPNALVPCTLSE